MANDIALQVRPIQLDNPVQQYANVLALQGAQNQNRLADFQYKTGQESYARQNALRTALEGAGGDEAAYGNALTRFGTPEQVAAYRKAQLESKELTGKIEAGAIERGIKTMGLFREQLGNVKDPQTAAQWVVAQYSDPNLGPIIRRMGTPEQALSRIPTDPAGFQTWVAQQALGMEKFIEKNAPQLSTRDVGGTIQDRTFRPLTGEISTLGTTAKTATPDALMADARGRTANAIAAGNLGVNQQRLADSRNPELQGTLAAAQAGGRETGEGRAKAALELPSAISRAESAERLIDDLIGDLSVDKNGKLMAAGRGKKQPHPGFSATVGATLLPGQRFVEGSDAADFMNRLEQIKGGAFLQAFETLKGGGQITEREGQVATQAITRINKAQSEAEFVKAARELQKVARDVAARVKQKAGGGGVAPGSVLKFDAQGNPI